MIKRNGGKGSEFVPTRVCAHTHAQEGGAHSGVPRQHSKLPGLFKHPDLAANSTL